MCMKHGTLRTKLEDTTRFNEAVGRKWTKKHVSASKDVDQNSESHRSTACSHLSSLTASTQTSGTYQHLAASMMNPASGTTTPPTDSSVHHRLCDMLEGDSEASGVSEEKQEAAANEPLRSSRSSQDDEQLLRHFQVSAAMFAGLAPRLPSSSMFIGEPRDLEFPVLWASDCFQHLTGLGEVLGRDFRSLINGMPFDSISSLQIRVEWRKFCEACMDSRYYKQHGIGVTLPDVDTPVISLAEGELAFTQTLASKSGELLRCLISFKQVELDGTMYAIGLLSNVPESGNQQSPRTSSESALHQINLDMEEVIAALAAEFFYSAPMRRQAAFPHKQQMCDLFENCFSSSLESLD